MMVQLVVIQLHFVTIIYSKREYQKIHRYDERLPEEYEKCRVAYQKEKSSLSEKLLDIWPIQIIDN
jgi:hypothetical protein